ncbi:tetratricopeptide repeat protein [Roseivirga misakiensis]|uniref:Uncharacterized protein n=1 Tax=Roseivirga misakiensis TaxID=1563681 RepID=A0A1E5T0X6_9BACT|nr:tetratricopeptide repeat protein [Roseivirga misakiensis]OEK05024.1 hypothetical protein BFP71_16515 [Roseivirga misakiensis]
MLSLLVFVKTLASQEPNLVGLHANLKSAKSDRQKTRIYNALSQYYADVSPDSSFLYAKKALDRSIFNDPVQAALAQRSIGHVFYLQGAYDQAIKYFYDALKAFEKARNVGEEARTLLALGLAYEMSKSNNKALIYFKKALSKFSVDEHQASIAETFASIGHYFEKKSDYDSAFFYQKAALDLYQALNDPRGLAFVNGNIGSIYEDLSQYRLAHEYFYKAAKYDSVTGNYAALVVSLNDIGDIFRKRQSYDSGLFFTKKALVLAKEMDLTYQIRSAFRDLSKSYNLLGDLSKAYAYQDSVYELQESLFSGQIANQIANFETLYETQEKDNEIAILESKQRAEKQVSNFLLFGAIGLAIFTILLLYQERKSRRKENLAHKASKALDVEKLKNIELQQKALETALENKRLKEEQFHHELEARSQDLTTKTLHIIQKNRLLNDLRMQLKSLEKETRLKKSALTKLCGSIDQSFQFDKEWEEFQRRFDQVHVDFLDRIQQKYPNLTPTEIKLCSLTRLRLASKDIAAIMGVTTDSLRISRYRLRKKINPRSEQKLKDFLVDF